jgi:hypothetical protein
MKIKKVGSIKINPFNILDFYKFLKGYVEWDPDFYSEYLKSIGKEEFGWAIVGISPEFILLPQYRYSLINSKLARITGIEREALNVIFKIENLSRYNIFKIEKEENTEKDDIKDYYIWAWTDGRRRKKATLDDLHMVFGHQNNDYTLIRAGLTHPEKDIRKIEKALEVLKSLDNVTYRSFPKDRRGEIFDKIEFIENSFMVMLNFLYTVYTGYERDKFSKLFDPITDMLKGYGSTFEDLIKTIRFIVAITG